MGVRICGYISRTKCKPRGHRRTSSNAAAKRNVKVQAVCLCVCVCEAKEKKKKSQGTTVAAGVGCAEGEQNLVTSACSSVARFSPGLIALEPVLFFFLFLLALHVHLHCLLNVSSSPVLVTNVTDGSKRANNECVCVDLDAIGEKHTHTCHTMR